VSKRLQAIRAGAVSMFLQITEGNVLVKILDLEQLINPNQGNVVVRIQAGEEEQDPEPIKKGQLSWEHVTFANGFHLCCPHPKSLSQDWERDFLIRFLPFS
jgi:hypothetical protein